MLQTEIK